MNKLAVVCLLLPASASAAGLERFAGSWKAAECHRIDLASPSQSTKLDKNHADLDLAMEGGALVGYHIHEVKEKGIKPTPVKSFSTDGKAFSAGSPAHPRPWELTSPHAEHEGRLLFGVTTKHSDGRLDVELVDMELLESGELRYSRYGTAALSKGGPAQVRKYDWRCLYRKS